MSNKDQLESMFRAVLKTSRDLEESYNVLKRKFNLLEIKLENNRRYLENILKSINTGVCSIDLDCKVTIFNREATSIFEIEEKDARGLNFRDIFPLNAKNVFDLVEMLKNTKKLEIQTKKKKKKKISISASPITDDGKMVGAVIIFSDITRIEELEEENRRKEKLAIIGQMAASIAHDIKNPLASIELLVPLMSDDTKKDILDNIMISIRRIDSIVNNTLLFTKTALYRPEYCNSVEFMESIESELYAHLHVKNIDFVKEVEDFSFVSDRNLLKSAVVNLIVNAVDAALSRVEIKVYQKNKKSVFEINDDGKGIGREEKKHIFEPFYTSKKNGTGLGLSIVNKAVSAIGGEIELNTNSRGTSFKIYI